MIDFVKCPKCNKLNMINRICTICRETFLFCVLCDARVTRCPTCTAKRLMSPAQAAAYLKETGRTDHVVHPSTIREWIRQGRIKNVERHGRGRGGGGMFIPAAELDTFGMPTEGGREGRPRRKNDV